MAKAVVNVDIDISTKSIEQLEQELEQINSELKGLEVGSEKFKELAKESAKVTDQLNKANKAAEGFTEEKKFLAADGAIKVLGGSLAGVVGTLGVIGVESEVFGDLEKKAASAIAVAIGIKDVSEGFRQLRESTILATTATKIFGKVSRTALISTGIGAIVVALGSIVAYWDEITEFITGASKEQRKLTAETEKYEETSNRELGILEQQKTLLELQGKDVTKINKQLRNELILQNQKLQVLLDQLKVELELEQAESRRVTFMEGFFAFAKDRLGIESFGVGLAKATNSENDRTKTLLEEINRIQSQILENKIGIQTIDNESKEDEDEETSKLEKRAAVTSVLVDNRQKLSQVESDNIDLMNIVKNNTDEMTSKQAKQNAATEVAIEDEIGRRAALYATGDALLAVGDIVGQQTAAGKALASSAALINTYLGITEVLKQESTLPSPFDVIVKIANVATILSTGLAAVKNINATPVTTTGTAGASGGIPTGGGRTPSINVGSLPSDTPAPQVTSVQPTVRAYVVSGDVNSAQEADARLNRRRSLG